MNIGIVSSSSKYKGFSIPSELPSLDPNAMAMVGTGEYAISWIKNDGTAYSITGNDAGYTVGQISGLTDITQVEGGQYVTLAKKSTGEVYSIPAGSLTPKYYNVDNSGNTFTADYIQGLYKNVLALKNGELYYWMVDHTGSQHNAEDILNQGYTGKTPKRLIQPAGKTLIKIASASSTSYGSLTFAWALASDGTIWKWDRSNTTPTQVTGGWAAGSPIDIAMVGCNAYVVVTSTNQIWAWGYLANYVGASPSYTAGGTPQNITTLWTSAGLTFPIKKVCTTYNTLHFIDANDNLFGAGSNVQGNVGNGQQWASWRTYTPTAYQWSLANEQVLQSPVQIQGKWKNIVSNNTVVFYLYGQDMGGNWYSWGRNKARVLGNGLSMTTTDEGVRSEYYNIPAPRLVTPITQSWTVSGSVNVNADRPPIANAGINQYLTGATSTTLYGSGSHQQQPTTSTTVTMSYSWTKISGPNCTIVSPTSQNTSVTGMSSGTYVFRNTVTNSNSLSDFQNVTVVIS